ncbi:nitrate/nitrite transporter NrtS [Sulfurospirillum sp. T05]|uniref:Nitrate/nitrite transporter NrtS n=1 Tax=Sulfurospirillum tamanense TaxID=2813362 RepID=A0ABS2WUS9_9BACT|nr:nitrate/nitrite transporter NrtS [Sulfurospirillum tamanensis]MBE0495472.1 nitrate/nitrite transporter NrtS [Campylobacterales bacterium]MBN2965406.1 nitrate/nitrite transporter NrtS [Sulfurospirillum tamanensis]
MFENAKKALQETLCDKRIVKKALKVSALVGTALVVINQYQIILAQGPMALDWIKVGLTYVVPFLVSLYMAFDIRLSKLP